MIQLISLNEISILLKNQTPEQNHIHYSEEQDQNDQCQHRFHRSQCRQKHQRKAKYHRWEVLINHIIGCRRLEVTINFPE